MRMNLDGLLRQNAGIDLGTANTLVYVGGKGIVLSEPTVVAQRTDDGMIIAVGEGAKRMIGRTPSNIVAVRPMRHGVISDFATTAAILRYFIQKAMPKRSLTAPRAMIGVPLGASRVERRAIIEAAVQAGIGRVLLIEQPLAAAIGAGLPIADPVGSLIVDIGGGTSEIALTALGGIVTARSIRIGGDAMDDAIMHFCRHTYNLLIGERAAEEVKIAAGSAYPIAEELSVEIRGRDLVTGLPRGLRLTSTELRHALADPVGKIVAAVKQTLEAIPPELAADIIHRGITLVGGGALLRGMDRLLAEETGLPVALGKDPLGAVALGTGAALEHMREHKQFISSARDV